MSGFAASTFLSLCCNAVPLHHPAAIVQLKLASSDGIGMLTPSRALTCVYWHCRSPRLWHQPDVFDPERFNVKGPIPNETTENYRYLPFGGGRRKCIGGHRILSV